MASNYVLLSSDDDFDYEVKKIKRPNYDSYDWNFDSSPEERSFMKHDSDGELILVPGQSSGKNSIHTVGRSGSSRRRNSTIEMIVDVSLIYNYIS